MNLVWSLDPKQINIQRSRSAAYQYTLINYDDGRAELSIQHRGDRPSGTPIKRFVYRNRNGAFGGAQRFEDKHGYRDPAHHAPAAVVPFLWPFSDHTRAFIRGMQERAQGLAPVPHGEDVSTFIENATMDYDEMCKELLCCRLYDCYNRTEPGAWHCDEHQTDTTTED
jgi:hypothetical protein